MYNSWTFYYFNSLTSFDIYAFAQKVIRIIHILTETNPHRIEENIVNVTSRNRNDFSVPSWPVRMMLCPSRILSSANICSPVKEAIILDVDTIHSKNFCPIKGHLRTQPMISVDSVESIGWGECCTVHFKKNKSIFFWNAVVSGIVCFVCWKGTLFLINGEVAFWGNFVLDKKNDETQDGVEVKCSTIIYSYTIEDSYYSFKYCWSVASGKNWSAQCLYNVTGWNSMSKCLGCDISGRQYSKKWALRSLPHPYNIAMWLKYCWKRC